MCDLLIVPPPSDNCSDEAIAVGLDYKDLASEVEIPRFV
jgi:hypothetical protein